MARKPSSKLDEVLDPQGKLPFEGPAGKMEGPPPVKLPIGSLEGMEFLLRELGWLQSRAQTIKAEAKLQLAAVATNAAGRLWTTIDGEKVAFADREAALKEAAEEFCKTHRKKLLQGDLKSRQLTHGAFGWEKERAKVVALERPGKGPGEWMTALIKLVKAAWAKLPGLAGKSAAFLSFKPTVNRTKLKEAALAGDVGGDELKQLGFRLIRGDDEVFFVRAAGVTLSATEEPEE